MPTSRRRPAASPTLLMDHGLRPGERCLRDWPAACPSFMLPALAPAEGRDDLTRFFSAFGPEPSARRAWRSEAANVLVTTRKLLSPQDRVLGGRDPTLKLILILGDAAPEGCVALGPAMAAAPPEFETVATGPDDPALIHFTFGHDRQAQGRGPCPQSRALSRLFGAQGAGAGAGVKYWCTADPGWVTGTSYGIIAPLVNRVTMLIDEAEFRPRPMVFHRSGRKGRGLVFRPHRDPHDDARRRRGRRALRLLVAAVPRQRRRAAEPPRPWSGARRSSASPFTTTGGRPKPAAS